MTQKILPWSLKGVSLEARQAAKQAAKDADVQVGTWLCATIREVAAPQSGETQQAQMELRPEEPT